MVQEVADHQVEDHPAHGAAEADQSSDGADDLYRKQVGGHDHDQGGPGLLSEKGDAEDADGPEGDLAGDVQGVAPAQQPAGVPAAHQATNAGGGVGDPGEVAHLLGVEAADIVEILRQPKQIEEPAASLRNLATT